MKLIVSGNINEFYDYCIQNNLNPKEVKYVYDKTVFFGKRNCEVIYYGSYLHRKDLYEIQKQEQIMRY